MIIPSYNGLSLFIALRANVQVQHMMERYDYASRTACLRNRIAISYHQNSKHESLPSGCLLGLCLSNIYPFTFLLFNVFVQFALFVFFKLSSSRAELGSIRVLSVISVRPPSSNSLSLFIALRAKVQVQHMMIRYDYASRTACLCNRIAIPFHQNSKHESLPSGCLLGLCLSP